MRKSKAAAAAVAARLSSGESDSGDEARPEGTGRADSKIAVRRAKNR
jgi:hypothetical protein